MKLNDQFLCFRVTECRIPLGFKHTTQPKQYLKLKNHLHARRIYASYVRLFN